MATGAPEPRENTQVNYDTRETLACVRTAKLSSDVEKKRNRLRKRFVWISQEKLPVEMSPEEKPRGTLAL